MTRPSGTYTLVDHTGDLAIRVEAASFEALLETAALALFDLLLEDRAVVKPRETIDIALDARASHEETLKHLLSELLYRFDVDGFVLAEIRVVGCAHARGERFDPARHVRTRGIKAVTYHDLAVTCSPDGMWSSRIVFDI